MEIYGLKLMHKNVTRLRTETGQSLAGQMT